MLERLEQFFGDPTRPTFVWQLDFAEVFQRRRSHEIGESGDASREAADGQGGFDITIANPPYLRQEKIKALKPLLSLRFPNVFTGTADLYVYFYALALQLLRPRGVLSYITSNKWYRVDYGEKLRGYLASSVSLLHIIDFGDVSVFTAVAYPTILIARNEAPVLDHKFRALVWDPKTPKHELRHLAQLYALHSAYVAQRTLSASAWRSFSNRGPNLIERLRSAGPPLRTFVNSRVYRGITTGYNKAFVVDFETRERLIQEDESAKDVLKPYLRGRDVQRWKVAPEPQWLIFTRRGVDIQEYPSLRGYLSQFKKKLLPGAAGGRKPGRYEWFEIQDNIAYWQQFERPKIISTKVSIRPTFAFDASGYYLGNTAYFFPAELDALYLLGVLNSKVSYAYSKRIFVEKQNDYYEVQPEGLELFPIPEAKQDHRAAIESVVGLLLFLHEQPTVRTSIANAPRDPLIAQYFEQWLDAMVYQLFFPEDLRSAQLDFFDLFSESNLRSDSFSPENRLDKLRNEFEELYSPSHPLRGALFALQSLEVVRAIEGAE